MYIVYIPIMYTYGRHTYVSARTSMCRYMYMYECMYICALSCLLLLQLTIHFGHGFEGCETAPLS